MPHPHPPFPQDIRRLGVGMYQHSDPPMTLQEVCDWLTPMAGRPVLRRTLYEWVLRAGVKMRRPGGGRSRHKPKIPRGEMEKRAEWLYRELQSLREVGRVLGVSHTWVRTALERRGVKRRPFRGKK